MFSEFAPAAKFAPVLNRRFDLDFGNLVDIYTFSVISTVFF